MKQYIVLSMLLLALVSCKKQLPQDPHRNEMMDFARSEVHKGMSEKEYNKVDFARSELTIYQESSEYILKIPFINVGIDSNFILLKVDKNLTHSIGKIFRISKNRDREIYKDALEFNGEINISSLDGRVIVQSPIKGGFVEAFHPKSNNGAAKQEVAEVPLLPEVVLISSYGSGGTWSHSDWYNLQGLISETPGNGSRSSGGFYTNSMGPAGAGGYSSNVAPPYASNSIQVDYEPVENRAAIDLTKYLNCFHSIPDEGSTCTIKILTDIPVDNDPNKFFDFSNGSPGHTFLQLTKSKGGQIVQQNIGFYPREGWKTMLTTVPVPGKFVDNAEHEFNASLTMDLSPSNFQTTLIHMQYLARFIKYDIDEYNCTDFALEVFNYTRGSNQLTIPRYDIPGGTAVNGTATPQGLYKTLVNLKNQSGLQATKITIPSVKGFAGASHGPCNDKFE